MLLLHIHDQDHLHSPVSYGKACFIALMPDLSSSEVAHFLHLFPAQTCQRRFPTPGSSTKRLFLRLPKAQTQSTEKQRLVLKENLTQRRCSGSAVFLSELTATLTDFLFFLQRQILLHGAVELQLHDMFLLPLPLLPWQQCLRLPPATGQTQEFKTKGKKSLSSLNKSVSFFFASMVFRPHKKNMSKK